MPKSKKRDQENTEDKPIAAYPSTTESEDTHLRDDDNSNTAPENPPNSNAHPFISNQPYGTDHAEIARDVDVPDEKLENEHEKMGEEVGKKVDYCIGEDDHDDPNESNEPLK